MFFWISEDSVVKELGEMLFDPWESSEKVEMALSIVLADYDGPSGDWEHKVKIPKDMAFELVGRSLTGTGSDFVLKWYNLPDRSIFSIFGFEMIPYF
jgi:hypothetical protein